MKTLILIRRILAVLAGLSDAFAAAACLVMWIVVGTWWFLALAIALVAVGATVAYVEARL